MLYTVEEINQKLIGEPSATYDSSRERTLAENHREQGLYQTSGGGDKTRTLRNRRLP